MRILLAGILALAVPASAAARHSGDAARELVHQAERAYSDDSSTTVAARWSAALVRDSTDRAALLGLGTLARLQYDFSQSERLFQRALRHTPAPDGWSVQARLGLYSVVYSQGNFPIADSLLRDAIAEARKIGDRGGEIDALIGFSNTRAAMGTLDDRFAALDSVRALLPPGDSRDRASYLCRMGQSRSILGDSAGPTLARQGTSMAERVGERRLTGHCLEAYALSNSMLGRGDSVLAIMDRAESLLRATHDHASLGRLASRRSDELQFRGRLGEAKAALGQVLAEAQISKNRERYAFAYGGLGMLALRVGDLPTAVDYFDRASALYDSIGQANGARIARENRAWVLSVGGDLDAARAALSETLKESEREKDFEDAVLARQQLARVAIRRGDWAQAAAQLDSAETESRLRGLGAEATVGLAYDRGRVALARGDLPAAERLFAGYLKKVSPEDRLHRYLVRVRLAEVWARRGGRDLGRAEREIEAAGRELETWRESLGDDELRSYAFAATALGEPDPQGPVARVLAELVRGGRVEPAFALAEQRRARTLADRLNQADALREAGIKAGAPAHRSQASTAPEIAAALPDERTALLEFVAGTEGSPTTLFLVTRAGVRARLLPPADSIAPTVRRLLALLEAGENAAGPAKALGKALLDPVSFDLAHITRIVVVPDGPLHRVPFDVLPLADGKPAVERWAFGLAPSATVAVRLWKSEQQAPSASPASREAPILALGDPAFPNELSGPTLESEVYRSAFETRGGLRRLAGSGKEAREVARFAAGGAEVRLREGASEQWLKHAALERFRVIHLATHALVDETSIARTALALAPGSGEDGFLSPADLAALRLNADLVVLSACRTAGGVAVAGEGIQGLTTPLLSAGARAVVATQWPIQDRSTVRLVEDLYAGLARGLTVAEALRETKLAAIRRGLPARDWAGLTVVGDPLVRVAVVTPPARAGKLAMLAVLAGVILLAGGIYLVTRWRERRAERGPGAGVMAITHH